MQIAELKSRLKEVAVDLDQRIRQELAFPAVVHFYSWLLQGDPQCCVTLCLKAWLSLTTALFCWASWRA